MDLRVDRRMDQHTDHQITEPGDSVVLDWTLLPQLVLSKICGLLEDPDRCHMAATCRAWSHVLNTPRLWRHRMLEISGNQGRRSCLFVQRFGRHIRDLTITCIPCSRLTEVAAVGSLEELLCCLRHVPLIELATVFSPMDLTCTSLRLFKDFLLNQYQLRNLQMYLAECTVEVGCGLLEAVAESSGSTLSHLALDEFFEVQEPLYQIHRFNRLLCRFPALSNVVMNYSCLGDATLLTLAYSLKARWRYLEIRVRKCDVHVHRVATATWRRARALCSGLRVSLYLCQAMSACALRVLSPGIPLTMVNLALCPPLPHTDPRLLATPKDVLAHLANRLHLMLEEVQLSSLLEDMAEAVMMLVGSCTEMRCLHLSSCHAAMLVHLARLLCQQRHQGKTRLKELFVYAKGTSLEESRILQSVQESYRPYFTRLCLYYSLTQPSPPSDHTLSPLDGLDEGPQEGEEFE